MSTGKLTKALIMLPGNRGTGTANEASVKSRKNARNTAPPRINIPPLLFVRSFSCSIPCIAGFWGKLGTNQGHFRPLTASSDSPRDEDTRRLRLLSRLLGSWICLLLVFRLRRFS